MKSVEATFHKVRIWSVPSAFVFPNTLRFYNCLFILGLGLEVVLKQLPSLRVSVFTFNFFYLQNYVYLVKENKIL